MISVHFILLLVAFLCFFLVAIGVASQRINLTGLGLAILTLAFLIVPK